MLLDVPLPVVAEAPPRVLPDEELTLPPLPAPPRVLSGAELTPVPPPRVLSGAELTPVPPPRVAGLLLAFAPPVELLPRLDAPP
jgi:hypothetical protein